MRCGLREIAIELHGIHRVVAIDYRDCGAYKIALGPEPVSTPDLELDAHRATLEIFAAEVAERHPNLDIGTYLMALDGSVEEV